MEAPSPAERTDRGRGWYYGSFPPGDVEFFHCSYQVAGPFSGTVPLILAPAAVFGSPAGRAFLTTDWQFHAWRSDPSGANVPLARNDLVGLVRFLFLVDDIPVRFYIRSTDTKTTVEAGFPYLDTRPGPQVQSPFGVVAPILDQQSVRAEARIDVAPVGFVLTRLGFEFSGIQMPQSRYREIMRGA